MSQLGTLVVISSPSGAGKNSIIRRLVDLIPNSTRFVTTTTRSPRPGEQEGKDYFFVSREVFESLLAEDKFIEHNMYADAYYGSEKAKLEALLQKYDFVFAALDVNGKEALDALHIDHISIFLLPEDMNVLEERIENRGGVDAEQLEKRLHTARIEIQKAEEYDIEVVNPEGKMEEAVQKIVEFLHKSG